MTPFLIRNPLPQGSGEGVASEGRSRGGFRSQSDAKAILLDPLTKVNPPGFDPRVLVGEDRAAGYSCGLGEERASARQAWFLRGTRDADRCNRDPDAGASAPIREELVFSDITFEDFYLSDACGTTVLDTVTVRLSVTFFPAAHGSPAHEVDTLNGSITYSSPDTGNSLTRPMNGTSHAVYPEGTEPGGPAVVTDSGVNTTSLTGTAPPGSGQLVANGTILFLDDLGVPITTFETSDIVSMRGNYAATTAEICAALT
jgi:hypothetical protein